MFVALCDGDAETRFALPANEDSFFFLHIRAARRRN